MVSVPMTFVPIRIGTPMNDTLTSSVRAERGRIGREQRMGGDVFHDQRDRGRHDLPDRRFRQARAVALVGAFVPADADGDIGNIVVRQQRNDAVPHLQERRKYVEDVGKRGFEPVRRVENFGNLVNSRERNLAQGNQRDVRPRFQALDIRHISVGHGDLSIVLDVPRRLF